MAESALAASATATGSTAHERSTLQRISREAALSSATSTRRLAKSLESVRMTGSAPGARPLQAYGAAESCPLAGSAFNGDFSAHHAHELLGDRQAESGAAVVSRGRRIDLRERAEEAVDTVGGDADAGVSDLEPDGDFGVGGLGERRGNHHLAVFGELDGVAGEIDEHLPQAVGVAAQAIGDVRVHVIGELE